MKKRNPANPSKQGFALIELSVVLVIIGLIAGGILVGRDMIKGAETRSQITQIEKYNTATNIFRQKYGYLPGDLPGRAATQFGFAARGPYAGQGDGDGLLVGNYNNTSSGNAGIYIGNGETGLFWEDLSSANLIDTRFSVAGWANSYLAASSSSSPNLDAYLPQAKIGNGTYVYVWSGDWNGNAFIQTNVNYSPSAASGI